MKKNRKLAFAIALLLFTTFTVNAQEEPPRVAEDYWALDNKGEPLVVMPNQVILQEGVVLPEGYVEQERDENMYNFPMPTIDPYDYPRDNRIPRENPFIGEWEGSVEGWNFTILFLHSNMCIIKVKTMQDGREITEETDGTWSYDDNFHGSTLVRINGNFPNSKIQGLERVNWTSVCTFINNDNTAFAILITPPRGSRQARITFARIFS